MTGFMIGGAVVIVLVIVGFVYVVRKKPAEVAKVEQQIQDVGK